MKDTKGKLLEAARRIYLDEGAEAVTMRSVARRVGVTPTALYRHYESKEALVDAVIASGFQVFGAYLHRSLAGSTAAERLRLSGQAYLDFALEQSEIYRTIFMAPRHHGGEADPDPRKASTFRFLVDRVEECIRSHDLRTGDAEDTALTIWAHVHGLVSLYLAGAIPMAEGEFRTVYRESLGRLFRGVGG